MHRTALVPQTKADDLSHLPIEKLAARNDIGKALSFVRQLSRLQSSRSTVIYKAQPGQITVIIVNYNYANCKAQLCKRISLTKRFLEKTMNSDLVSRKERLAERNSFEKNSISHSRSSKFLRNFSPCKNSYKLANFTAYSTSSR